MKTQSDRCMECANAVPCVSENGLHRRCTLSSKRAMNCLLGKKDEFVSRDIVMWLLKEKLDENT